MASVIAEVFAARGDSALVMRGEDGLDEFTTTAPTRLWAVAGGRVSELVVDAKDLGLPRAKAEDLRGGDAPANAEAARRVFAGGPGPVRDAVVLNAAAALAAYEGFAKLASETAPLSGDDVAGALRSGIDRAAAAIDSGAAEKTLARWISVAQAASA